MSTSNVGQRLLKVQPFEEPQECLVPASKLALDILMLHQELMLACQEMALVR